MQPLHVTSNMLTASRCAAELLETLPTVTWFIRRQMRGNRRNLSVPQFRTLVRVSHHPGTPLSDVAEHLGASLPTTSRIVAGLVKKGYLTRCGSEADRRRIALDLTTGGRAVLKAARAATQDRLEVELGRLSDPQRNTLLKAMAILQQTFGDSAAASGKEINRDGNGHAGSSIGRK